MLIVLLPFEIDNDPCVTWLQGTEVGIGDGVNDGVGVAVGAGLPPVQGRPFNVNAAGVGLLPECVPWKPKLTVPPFAAMVPFQLPAGLEALTVLPLCEKVAFQPLVTCCPAVKSHERI